MLTKLFFGSYYLKQCKSYLADLLKNNSVAKIDQNTLEDLDLDKAVKSKLMHDTNNSNILCVGIPSRHHRRIKPSSAVIPTVKHRTRTFDEEILSD
jgi:hypothetical protein